MNFPNKIFLLPTLLFALLVVSCQPKKQTARAEEIFNSLSSPGAESWVQYAKGFAVYQAGGITKLVIYEPGLSEKIRQTFYLATQEIAAKYGNPDDFVIVPLERVAVFSGTQLNAMKNLGLLEKIVGVSEANYILDIEVRKNLAKGRIIELAGNGTFYVERALQLNPSVIFHSPYQSNQSNPLAATKIPMIPFLDFMENDPLGRAEWLKFTAVFFGEEAVAEQQFRLIVEQYETYKTLVSDPPYRPTVFSDKYFSGQWYVSGGQSYIATLFKDAGADYIWENDEHIASFPLDFETVFSQAGQADFWRIVLSFGDEPSYEALAAENELYTHFSAFKNRHIIWCDAQKTAYFETATLEPHRVLADFIKIFHPDLLPDYQAKYYTVY